MIDECIDILLDGILFAFHVVTAVIGFAIGLALLAGMAYLLYAVCVFLARVM